MIAISPRMDLAVLQDYASRGLLRSASHPDLPLTIWNYTPKTQFDRAWDDITLQCRGLITNDRGDVVARPLPKFFGLTEWEQTGNAIPDEPFEVFEKLDGSLIIVTPSHGQIIMATRGSFTSIQVGLARTLLSDILARTDVTLCWGVTYCFELIHPTNRIVVDYGDREDLVLLTTIDTVSGREIGCEGMGFPVVRREECSGGFRDLPQRPNEEGYVVRFQAGLRLKLKNAEYIRLHRLLTCTSPITIWEALRDDVPVVGLLDHVPDEFRKWVLRVQLSLRRDAHSILDEATAAFNALDRTGSRKDSALQIQAHPRPMWPILFALLDNKPVMPIIWKMVRPTASSTFLEEDR